MRDLPTGTVTFLFTDIEGSTRLWEEDPEAMRAALSQHDALLQRVIKSHSGHVFKTVGDQFCAAFATAPDALAAALSAQRSLQKETWPDATPLRVRMALHTGTVEQREGDYFGPPLNRIARLLPTGHGGQILLSQPTCELVRDHLPEQASLRDLGEYRLKDLARPERVFQLLHPELPAEFPPLQTLDARPNNLPAQLTPLIGRDKEVAAGCDLVRRDDVRLVTLTGPGGTGKTRLGLQIAADLLDEFPAGVFFVGLAPIADPTLVVPTIAQTLGIRQEGATIRAGNAPGGAPGEASPSAAGQLRAGAAGGAPGGGAPGGCAPAEGAGHEPGRAARAWRAGTAGASAGSARSRPWSRSAMLRQTWGSKRWTGSCRCWTRA